MGLCSVPVRGRGELFVSGRYLSEVANSCILYQAVAVVNRGKLKYDISDAGGKFL